MSDNPRHQVVTQTLAGLSGLSRLLASPGRTGAEQKQHAFGVADGSGSHGAELAAREAFVDVEGVTQPAPAPRFSKTPGAVQGGPVEAGEGGDEALKDWGVERA